MLDFYENGKLLSALVLGIKSSSSYEINEKYFNLAEKRIDVRLLIPATWIFFFYSASPFLINILGVKFSEYSNIILQLTGLCSALGTLALAFILDPKLSRQYEMQTELHVALNSLFFAHMLNILVMSPLFFSALYVIFG